MQRQQAEDARETVAWMAGIIGLFCFGYAVFFGWCAVVALHQNIPLHGVVEWYSGNSKTVRQQFTVQALIVDSTLLLAAAIAAFVLVWCNTRKPKRH